MSNDTTRPPWNTIILLATLAFASTFSTAVVFPNIGSFVRDRFVLSDTAASLFAVSYLVPHVIFAFVWGAWSDRVGKRKPFLIGGYAATAVFHFLLPFAPTYPWLLLLRVAEGATSVLGFSLVMTIAADLARGGHRGKVMGLMGGAVSLGTSLAFPVGGALGVHSMLLLCGMGAVILLLCAAVAWRWLPEGSLGRARSLRDALAVARDYPALALPYAFTFIDRFTVGFFAVTFPLYAASVFGMDAAASGRLLAGFLLPFSLLTFVFGRMTDRIGPMLLLLGGSLVYGVFVTFTGYLGQEHLLYLMIVLGVLAAAMYAPTLWMVAAWAPAERKASAMGGFNAAGSVGFSLGPLVGGVVADLAGYAEAFIVAGVSEVLIVLVALPVLYRMGALRHARIAVTREQTS